VGSAREPGAVAWPDKMITQAEAFAKAASWRIYPRIDYGTSGSPDINLICDECRRSMGQLRYAGTVYNGSLDEMLSMVLRHMVQAHDVALNTRGMQDNGASDGSTHG
jgi:hypothetical protein